MRRRRPFDGRGGRVEESEGGGGGRRIDGVPVFEAQCLENPEVQVWFPGGTWVRAELREEIATNAIADALGSQV